MLKFAVIGNGIKHSLSPSIHKKFAKQVNIKLDYEIIEATDNKDFINKVTAFFNSGGTGLSVTFPFKRQAYELAQHKHQNALQSQSGNTLWLNKNNILQVENTDGPALITDFKAKNITIKNKILLILGCGGAVFNIIKFLLAESPQKIIILNRTMSKISKLIEFLSLDQTKVTPFTEYVSYAIDLVIDGRSVTDDIDIINKIISYKCSVYSLGYGAPVENIGNLLTTKAVSYYDGLGMLVRQAALQFSLWHGVNPDIHLVYLEK